MINLTLVPKRFMLVGVVHPKISEKQMLLDFEELQSLVQTFGAGVVAAVYQKNEHPDHATYIGSGKAEEVGEAVAKERIDVVVLNSVVKPGQIHNLEKILFEKNPLIKVWDRVDLILQIFQLHAHTAEAKLQIDLAMMRHMGPRIYGMGFVLSRQGGGIGTLGIGETNTELMQRHWRNEMKKITDELEKLAGGRERQIEQRKRAGIKTVAIVGYTNAGKTTLFNRLTGKKMLVEDALFATLDSSVGRLYLKELQKEILISDTIGFIKNLPATLINAFTSTLMESIHADVLLHVIDTSDPQMEEKIAVVKTVLHAIHADMIPQIYVFNKIDKVKKLHPRLLQKHYKEHSPVFISLTNQEGVEKLEQTLGTYFSEKIT